MRIAFVGTGSMGSALLEGVTTTPGVSVIATTQSAQSAHRVHDRLSVDTLAVEEHPDANIRAIDGADIVFLGVKPWMMTETLTQLAPHLNPTTVVVSMAAGYTLDTLHRHAPHNPVIRIMPNTPSQLGKGVIALAPGALATQEHVDALTTLLAGAGRVFPVTEEQIGAMVAIAGSGVAYFFLLAEALVTTGVALGLDQQTATDMVVQTAASAGALLERTPDPAQLRQAVTSKGGTTQAAIETFVTHGLTDTVRAAAQAAVARGKEMEQENT